MKKLIFVLAIMAATDAHAWSTGDMSPSVSACDQLAFNGSAVENPNGVTPLGLSDLNPSEALPKCHAAHDEFPGHLRTIYHLGRLYSAAGNEEQAIYYLTLSAEGGFAVAFNNLANLYDGSNGSFGNDPIRTRTYRQLGCLQGNGPSCARLGDEDPTYFSRAFTQYEANCELDHGTSCRWAGHLLNDTDKPIHDDALSLTFFERGCELEDANACANIGLMHLWRDVPGKNATVAIDRLSTACSSDINEAWACQNLGRGYEDGEFGTPDYVAAADAYETGCNQGHAKSCRWAGHLLNDTDKPIHDDALSLTFFERGCELEDANACANIGWMHLWRDVPGKNATVAIDRLSTACSSDINEAWACQNLGRGYEDGEFGDVDFEKAEFWFNEGCTQDDGGSCGDYGDLLEDGDLGASDDSRAAVFFERGCELNSGWSCGRLADLHNDGDLGTPNMQLAESLFEKGCNLDHAWSCGNLGNILISERAAHEEGITLLQKGCDLNDSYSCKSLGNYYNRSGFVPRDLERAASLYEFACQQDDEWACSSLGYANEELGETAAAAIARLKACELGNAESCATYGISVFEAGNIQRGIDFSIRSLEEGNNYLIINMDNRNAQPGSRRYLTAPRYDGLRKGIQRHLRSRGLYNGSIDGIFGPNMERSMRALCDC